MGVRDDEDRPDPDALLERVEAEEQEASRAKLRLFFGASPGVGKTFTMLENAQRLRREGVDVVVGVVETHGREETAGLLRGLEQLPRKRVVYRGRTLEEFDIDAALASRPAVLLLDELAHTNVPGSRHHKRWQDAMELLDAGIEVHSTLNVQHVESLNDVVAQITHVRVRETVPDAVIERADEIELVDVPSEVVLGRLEEGKVYLGETAERARGHFFKEGNLHALRELALRVTAERVDAQVQAWRRQHGISATWPARERIMVCVGPSPASARVVRSAKRMATVLRAPWIAAYVEKGAQSHRLAESDRLRLAAHLMLAESLGAEVVGLSGEKPGEALLQLARERNVTRIVAGKPTHARWRDLIYGSLLDDLLRGSGDIDVHVIAGMPGDGPAAAQPDRAPRPVPWAAYARAALGVAIATGIGALVRERVDLADIAMLYLVAIAGAAAFVGRWPSFLASVLAVGAFDFFFVPPFYTFVVDDLKHAFTFAVMLVAGLAISSLTDRIRRQSIAARSRERRTAALFALTRALAGARDVDAIARVAEEHVRDVFTTRAALLLRDANAQAGLRSPLGAASELGGADATVARWSLEHAKAAGRGTDTLPGAGVVCLPLMAAGEALGVLAVGEPTDAARLEDPEQRHLLQTFVAQIALAVERAQLASEAQLAQVRAETEEMRSSLLSSVSHDLRTPIATILGSATMIAESEVPLDMSACRQIAGSVRDEAARLERLVKNLLDMTRVESKSLDVRKEWIPIEELVGAVMTRFEPLLEGREVKIDLAADCPLVAVDPVLFEQVLINLMENAVKHTPSGTPIEIRAETGAGAATIEISDRGPGLGPDGATKIFEKFVRVGSSKSGVGLGLAICRGIVVAHGGTITAMNRAGGGTTFRIVLPLPEPPALSTEEGNVEEGARP